MHRNTGGKVPLTQYFQAVDRKLEREKIQWKPLYLKICGRVVKICFSQEEMKQYAMRSLSAYITDACAEPDAVFFYWYGNCEGFLPPEKVDRFTTWTTRDETGSLILSNYTGQLIGADFVRRRFYFSKPEPEGIDFSVYGRALQELFSRWASVSQLYLLHAAAVGTEDGKGVLVVGRSGSGKSTFSISCLTAGMSFVSDDCVLITAAGPLQAIPLYDLIAVNPDMYAWLPNAQRLEGLPSATLPDGKLQFELPLEWMADKVEIKAIVLPRVDGDAEPAVCRTQPDSAMAHLLHSTAVQMGRGRDTELVRQIAQRLAGLPVYEMRMSTDLAKNPAYLRRFIEKEF